MSEPTYADISSELVAVYAELEALAYGFRMVHDSEDEIALGCAELLSHIR